VLIKLYSTVFLNTLTIDK